MGANESYLSSTEAVVTVVAVVAVGLGYSLSSSHSTAATSDNTIITNNNNNNKKKKSKKKKGKEGEEGEPVLEPRVVAFPDVIPGQFELELEEEGEEGNPAAPARHSVRKTKKVKPKGKAKEGTSDTTPLSSIKTRESKDGLRQEGQQQQQQQTAKTARTGVDGWTRVEARRRDVAPGATVMETPSDAGLSITTSATSHSPNNNSDSDYSEPDSEPDTFLLNQTQTQNSERRTLAERLIPKPRKTGVADMLETPDYPTLSRVIRVQPLPDEKPASGFTWQDYEDVRIGEGEGNEADGEEDGWGVVKSRRSKTVRNANSEQSQSQKQKQNPESMTKKQRQNAHKREAQKVAKADAEKQRLAALAMHKKQLEKEKIMEQYKTSSKALSGGMKYGVDGDGKLVWE